MQVQISNDGQCIMFQFTFPEEGFDLHVRDDQDAVGSVLLKVKTWRGSGNMTLKMLRIYLFILKQTASAARSRSAHI